jgi:diadenylate cyclase
MGEGRLVRSLVGVSSHERVRLVEEVASAVEALASRRTGALVVLERAVGLRQYADLGVPLEALVSADLLVSLFQPASPLHDGAVLVQGSRAVAAGCFLPLSRNVHIGRALGTRHRAALGISEETDAVALSVSEETGRISIAIEGQIEPANDGEGLRARLNDLLAGELTGASETSLVRGVRRWLLRAHDSAQNSG